MKLYEILDSSMPWEWEGGTPHNISVAKFQSGKHYYELVFIKDAHPLDDSKPASTGIVLKQLQAPDSIMGSMDITNTGNAFSIFSITNKIINDFVKGQRLTTRSVFFSAKEPSRIKLYQKFIDVIVKRRGWSVEQGMSKTGNIVWVLEP